MKRIMKIMMPCLLMLLAITKTNAQSFEIQQLILDVNKLAQLKSIYKNLVKGYTILSKGYNAVKDISEGNFDLHKLFLDELMKVSPLVRKYQKVADIINCEIQIVSEYGKAYDRFKSDNHFSPGEIIYIGKVYSRLIDESLKGLSDLTSVISDGVMRASDDERLRQIDKIDADMKDRLQFLRYFNINTTVLAIQRAKEQNDVVTLRNIYGVNN